MVRTLDFDQPRQIQRVSDKIAGHVCAFFASRGLNRTFSNAELLAFVQAREACAPDSAARIMRLLRRKGRIDYTVISRADSLYQITGVAGA